MIHNKAIIFGATSTLAQEVARNLIDTEKNGVEFVLLARDAEKLLMVSRDLEARGAVVESISCDFNHFERHDEIVHRIQLGNSFWFFYGSLPDQENCESDWDITNKELTTNFLSCASLLTRLVPLLVMREEESQIIVVSSVAGDRARKSNYVYGTAKGALSLYCQGLRNRLAKTPVHLMTVKPGFIDTEMTAAFPKTPALLWAKPQKVANDIVRAHRMKRDVLYTPWFWRYILLVIRMIPEKLFKRLSL